MRHAVVSDGVVRNVVVWDGESSFGIAGAALVPDPDGRAHIGLRYDGAFEQPSPPEPPTADRATLVTQAIALRARITAADALAAEIPEASAEAQRLRVELDAIKARLAEEPRSP